jgi:VWFA-related protein
VRLRIAVLLALAAAAGTLAQQAPPGPPPIFRVQVDAIELDAFVTDAQGNPVTDLTIDDFELFEEGRRQTITSLSQVNIPIERIERPLFSPREIEPDVQTNSGPEGRLYVIALDEVRPDLALRTRHFLRRFIEQHFAANDVAALVYVGRGRASDAQDFTSSRRLLLNAIDKFGGGFPNDSIPPAGIDGLPLPLQRPDAEAEALTRARMRSLRDLIQFMSAVRGRRKTMLYVTEQLGDVYSVLDYNGGARSIAFDDLHAAMTAATRGNVSIYPIDPRGLSPEGGLGDATVAPEAPGTAGLQRVQELRVLADATGGFAVVNSNSFDQAFTRIVRENSAYYVLGFTSTNERRDGRFRKLEVRIRRPGLVVRARNGYVAPLRTSAAAEAVARDSTAFPRAVAESLASPLEVPGVPMRVFAAAYKGPERLANVVMAIELDANALDLVEQDGAFVTDVAVAATAIASGGKLHPGQRYGAKLRLRPETYESAKAAGVRVLSEMQLPPGRYQLRVAGGTTSGRAGSVLYDLEVADFTREPLMMSGVSLSSRAVQPVTVSRDEPLRGLLPGPITATRDFRAGDTISLYTEVYENLRNPAAHTVDMQVDLRTDDGRVISTTREERSSRELGGRSGGYGFTVQVPLRDVEPGIYVIHVEAQVNMGSRPTVARDVVIRVK